MDFYFDVIFKLLKLYIEKNKQMKASITSDSKRQDKINSKMEQLTENLQKSSTLMKEIEVEFEQQKLLAEEWSNKAKISKNIVELSQEEVDAVKEIFGEQLNVVNSKNSKFSILWGAIFCVIGIIGGFLLAYFFLNN